MIRQYFSRERVKGRRQPYCPVNVAFTSSRAYNVSCQERAVQRDLRTGFESMRFSRLADILQPQHGNLSNLKSSLQLKFRHPPLTDLKAPVSCMPLTTMQQYDVITDTIQRFQYEHKFRFRNTRCKIAICHCYFSLQSLPRYLREIKIFRSIRKKERKEKKLIKTSRIEE